MATVSNRASRSNCTCTKTARPLVTPSCTTRARPRSSRGRPLDLTYTPEQKAFRAEVRAWMDKHVPKEPLPNFDMSREGFEAHREWERTLNSGRWAAVTWPRAYGGRNLDLIQWLIFEEEYY